MPWYLGIDTSNYTTSCAAYNPESGELLSAKRPLSVKPGEVGLRQSDAVFQHVKQLEDAVSEITRQIPAPVAVGASVRPRDAEGSYMPCFMAGKMAVGVISAALSAPIYEFSHQAGHLAAALYATDNLKLLNAEFLAFHVSGGTTESMYVYGGEKPLCVKLLATSNDLYIGQAVDRIGAMLGLAFPAGPALEQLALESQKSYKPRPAFKGGNPCISGVENQCRTMLEKNELPCDVAAYCLAYIREVILRMTEDAMGQYPGLSVIYAGGVMSNGIIKRAVTERFGGFFAPPVYSADNAAGIAVLCAFSHEGEGFSCKF